MFTIPDNTTVTNNVTAAVSAQCSDYFNEEPSNSSADYELSEPWQYAYGTACAMITIVGAIGNTGVIWICLYYRRMRTITNFFIANLAVADLLSCVINVPLSSYFILQQNWIFGQFLCTVVNFIASSTVVASVLTMMCISIDRYIAIVHPMRPRMGRMTAYVIIGIIWFVSGMFSLPQLMYNKIDHIQNTTNMVCFLQWEDETEWAAQKDTLLIYQSFYMVITYFVPLISLTLCYGRVAQELWGSKSIGEATVAQMEQIKSKRKLVKVLIWVMITFMINWAPYHIWFVVTSINPCIRRLKNMAHVFTSAYVLAMSNSIYNPIIYIILNNKFRQGFRQIFRWLPCIDWSPSQSLNRNQTTAATSTSNYHFRDRISSYCPEYNATTTPNRNSSIALNLHGNTRQNGTHLLAIPRSSLSAH
ncbi:tachykinin-like peptides receptor 99D [Paramacrobiotus metropolitanus]|uniref:tachykinin-like peptides receptor 99D n=1 Tax=Paramacrobiotus metropolitanus TaxID=2943436 RepID=UPI002445B98E|nr:tachykinin-like peptides receptor 99D [Paramacrobiotus metropolitanus]